MQPHRDCMSHILKHTCMCSGETTRREPGCCLCLVLDALMSWCEQTQYCRAAGYKRSIWDENFGSDNIIDSQNALCVHLLPLRDIRRPPWSSIKTKSDHQSNTRWAPRLPKTLSSQRKTPRKPSKQKEKSLSQSLSIIFRKPPVPNTSKLDADHDISEITEM